MNTGMSLGRRRRMPHPWALLKGLTMVEMLVVIGICGVLAMMLVPLTLHSRAKARTVVCANNLQGLGQAFSVCLTESENYFPEAYYVFEGAEGAYQVALRTPDLNQPDALLKSDYSQALSCPSDDEPVEVLGRAPSGAAVNVTSSYGYNVALPLMFLNASRVGHPANTVTFYDGDAAGVVGTWEHSAGWAADTIRPRHQGGANYLFLDGHVERSESFPDVAFDGGSRWLASALDTANPGGAGGWDLGGGSGDGTHEGATIGGLININPNNNPNFDFKMVLPNGVVITREDLHSDNPHHHCGTGFHPDYLEYTGPATLVRVKPKGNGNQNSLTVDGEGYPLLNRNRYMITADSMTVHLYNDKRNRMGKSMGKWWIGIDATGATITIFK